MRTMLTAMLMLSLSATRATAQIAAADCFPIERLPADLRPKAEALLLEAMDSNALYTIVSGLKPMTSNFLASLGRAGALNFAVTEFRADTPLAKQADELRQTITVLQCGDELRSSVLSDVDIYGGDGRSSIEPYVFNVPAMRRVMTMLPEYFASLGITPHTAPDVVLLTMQRATGTAPNTTAAERQAWSRAHVDELAPRNRATGLLYGYPRPAVDAYVETYAKVARGEAPPDAGGDPRALVMTIPSFKGESTWYRKAAPEESAEDKALRASALAILAEYRTRREKFIGPGKPGIVALLRDWYCTAERCAIPMVTR
jgi:hypothetical protein